MVRGRRGRGTGWVGTALPALGPGPLRYTAGSHRHPLGGEDGPDSEEMNIFCNLENGRLVPMLWQCKKGLANGLILQVGGISTGRLCY